MPEQTNKYRKLKNIKGHHEDTLQTVKHFVNAIPYTWQADGQHEASLS
jgi:hypothetical protein